MVQEHTGIPGPKGYPLIGSLPRFRREPLSTLVNAQREWGDVVRMDLGLERFYLLSHPEHVEHVLQGNAKGYVKGYDKVRVLLGNGLVMNEGESWLRQRRLMQPAFHRERLAGFAKTMVEETERMLERWECPASEEPALNVAREMTLLTQRIIVRTMFGFHDVGEERGERIAGAFDTALLGIEARSLMPAWFGRLPLPSNRRFRRAHATLDEEVYRIIRERRRHQRDGEDDLLGMLMEARDEESGEPMDDQQLRDEVMTIYLAGHETMANALSWAWYLLSKNPEAAREVREEASRVLGGRTAGSGDLSRLVYTRMVIDETLRLYPPAWILTREAVEDDGIGEYRIPAGSKLLISPYVTHHRADLWENPEGFDPERFAPGNGDERPRYAYYPFGGGQRMCIGNNFALMEAALIMSTVTQRYRLDLAPDREVKAQPKTTLAPLPAVWMTVHAV